MKLPKLLLVIMLCLFFFSSCEKEDSSDNSSASCGTYNGHILYKGPEGGCYYYNSNQNKTYVERSECDC